jgi:hypothetical protein
LRPLWTSRASVTTGASWASFTRWAGVTFRARGASRARFANIRNFKIKIQIVSVAAYVYNRITFINSYGSRIDFNESEQVFQPVANSV